MTNTFKDGTYLVTRDGSVVDYAARFAYGYIVATTYILPPTTDASMVAWAIGTLPKGTIFGVWTNPATGHTYLDYVTHVDTGHEAWESARKADQLSVWDLRESRERWVLDVKLSG